jgi:hypothetical protein
MIIRHKGATYPIGGAVDYDLLRRLLDDRLSK